MCWRHSRCAGSVGGSVVLVGGGACGGMCAGSVGGSVVLVGGGACGGMCAGSVRAVLVGRLYLSAVAVVLACVLVAFAPMLVVLALAWMLVFCEPLTE